jgi:hypothetical protein
MDRIIEASSDQTNWPETVTGVWGDANAAFEDASFAGYLVLVDDGGRITGVSTTGNSIWRGRFVNGVLTATYNGQYGNGSVRLELSDDGSTLTGTWESGDSRGTYTAVRATQIDRNELINHLQERMGEWLEIRE